MADSCLRAGKFSAPGFRFHPTDEELVMYYLKRKICKKKLRVNTIGVVDVYKLDPEELPGQSLLKTGDRQWFYFTPRSRKYPNAARSGRCTTTGYWKATGKDRVISYNSRSVGLKKTLVFYRGRAPTGERTDWVMHEYTMDEDELGRCKNAKEYYALYKLFKKSGAGPKNGEEYGAPFQEEEWVDEEDGDEFTVPEEPVVRYEDNDSLFKPVNVQLDDLEEILSGIPYAPGVPQTCTTSIPQVNREEELQSSTLVNNSAREFLKPLEIGDFLPNDRPSSYESIEVTSAPNNSVMEPLVFEKEDYIEMDDLLTPELGASLVENPAQLFNPVEYGDFNDFDQLFHDVSMSLDLDPILQLQDQTPENKLNNIMDPPSSSLSQFTDDLWLQDDDQAILFDQPQSIISGAFASPSSGVIPGSTNLTTSVNAQDQEGENGGGGTSPFSSALWAFMDSIPSTPASACEGPINKTFVRMSSFSRIRFSGKANGTPVTTSVIAKKRSRNRGFLLLSFVGALCAIFWVLVSSHGSNLSGDPSSREMLFS